ASKMPGLDGQKMSKSYNNTLALREEPDAIEEKIRTMPTDPARVRRTDPGDPMRCPVWGFHQVYSSEQLRSEIDAECRSAGIGCIDCKKHVIEAVQAELAPIRDRAAEFEKSPDLVRNIIHEGCEAAREEARLTMEEVRDVMGLGPF
ncbi:MAG: tryptophan--tRNA ligase, partial [Gammaproteobacteria bacterium]